MALGADFQHIPFSACFGHGIDFGDIHQSSRPIGGIWSLIKNIGLIGIGIGHFQRIFSAKENATISGFIDKDFGAQFKISIDLFGDQIAIALACLDQSLMQGPIGIADGIPVIQRCAIKQNGPALARL